METPQPDKTGMHILLKLASLVVIPGIHAAADIIVQLLLALFFATFSTRSSPGLFVGGTTPRCHYDCGCGDADHHRAGRRTGGIV